MSKKPDIVEAKPHIYPVQPNYAQRQEQIKDYKDSEIERLRSELGTVWKRVYKLEEENRQQRAIVSGVLEGTSGLKKAVVQAFMPIYMAEGKIDGAIKHFGGQNMKDAMKWIIIGLLGLVAAIYLFYHPEVIAGLQQSLNSPLVLAVLAIIFVAIFYIVWRTRNSRGGGK
jgi:hypothetical protein